VHDADAEGWIEVTGAPGAFPSPDDEGEGVECIVTNLSVEGRAAGARVQPDGSCVVRILAESGDELAVQTGYPGADESQPCYLVVP
jgi:hypothetical protein